MGTFLFILFGTILGGALVTSNTIEHYGYYPISIAVIITSIFGRLGSYYIPITNSSNKEIIINFNPLYSTIRSIKLSCFNKVIFNCIHGISWFWFFGFFFLATLPSFTRDVLKGDETVATFFLTLISLGMGTGSIIAKKLFRDDVKLGVVPFSAFSLAISGLLFANTPNIETINSAILFNLYDLNQTGALITPSVALLLVGISGGTFIVPLYTQLQISAPKNKRSQIIASNNIVNSIYMVLAAIFSILLIKIGLEIHQIFSIVSFSAVIFSVYFIFKFPREFYLIFFRVLMRSLYKINYNIEEPLPNEGPVILASNHISFIDPLLITSGTNRPPIFIMDQYYFDIKLLQWFFTSAEAIPIVPSKVSKDGLETALKKIDGMLKKNQLIGLFPEGFISKNGELQEFKSGIKTIADKHPEVKIIPMAISGMWGSWFSRHPNGKAMTGFPKRRGFFRTNIQINIGAPVENSKNLIQDLEKEILKLRTEK